MFDVGLQDFPTQQSLNLVDSFTQVNLRVPPDVFLSSAKVGHSLKTISTNTRGDFMKFSDSPIKPPARLLPILTWIAAFQRIAKWQGLPLMFVS